MSKEQDGGPAFPATYMEGREHPTEIGEMEVREKFSTGMSLRDYFAAKALSGMHARDTHDEGLANPAQRAKVAYIDADAMIKAREQ